MTTTVKIDIGDQLRSDLLSTALEGGSNYWYLIPDHTYDTINNYIDRGNSAEPLTSLSGAMWKAIKDGKQLVIKDIDSDEEIGSISYESIGKGEQLMADNHMHHFTNLLSGLWDAETADVWFQLAVMGELTYG